MSILVAALLLVTALPTTGSAVWYLSGPVGSPGVLVDGEGVGPSGLGVVVQVAPGEHLEFMSDHNGLQLDGRAVVRLWTSSAEPGTTGDIRVSLLACEQGACRSLASTRLLEEPWARGDSLEPKSVELPPMNQVLEPGERICLRIEVLGDRAIVVGYGSSEHPSSVTLPFGDGQEPTLGAGGTTTKPNNAPRSPEPYTAGIAESVPEDRSDLVSRPGLGFASGIAATEAGWLPPVLFGVVVTSALAALSALAASARRAAADRYLRTRTLPGRPARQ